MREAKFGGSAALSLRVASNVVVGGRSGISGITTPPG
jgi:hypothetical protein